ncbi:MAG: hypothetical protein K6G75_05820 [Lachnospiraceae bacterium]|nr:hypothetical protein [Lachnospiraceae bacterium]
MSETRKSKLTRQLMLFEIIRDIRIDDELKIYPAALRSILNVSPRTLERDLLDLRYSGLINVKYNKNRLSYVEVKNNDSYKDLTPRQLQHIRRLYRIGTLIESLPRTKTHEIDEYLSDIREFEEYVILSKEEPEDYPPEDIDMMRDFYLHSLSNIPDLKAIYYSLFPDVTDRTRQRDFEEMRKAGFDIYYHKDLKAYFFEEYDE